MPWLVAPFASVLLLTVSYHAVHAQIPPSYIEMIEKEGGTTRITLLDECAADSALVESPLGISIFKYRQILKEHLKRLLGHEVMLAVFVVQNDSTSTKPYVVRRDAFVVCIEREAGGWFSERIINPALLDREDQKYFPAQLHVLPGNTGFAYVVFPKHKLLPSDRFFTLSCRVNYHPFPGAVPR